VDPAGWQCKLESRRELGKTKPNKGAGQECRTEGPNGVGTEKVDRVPNRAD
jgi:hypothetical protein